MRRRLRCLLYDPYVATLGGGERYLFAIASALEGDADVVIGCPTRPDRERLEHLGLPSHHPVLVFPEWQLPARSARFDRVVCVTNDPPYPSFARRSYLIVQFPFEGLGSGPLRRAVSSWSISRYECVVYSTFVETWVDRRWRNAAVVLSPPVELGVPDAGRKEPLILAVGRFFPVQHSKRQDVLLEAYASLLDVLEAPWKLVLAGSVADDAGSRAYLDRVRTRAAEVGADVVVTPSAEALGDLYGRASLFWHATGFGRAPDEPEKAEHFGISTVEAMSFGAVPLVYDDGGQREIVDPSFGVRWRTVEELVDRSAELCSDAARRSSMAERAVEASAKYGADRFSSAARSLILGGA